jgi:hypothetical protein
MSQLSGNSMLSSLLPSKLLSERSTRVEYRAWYEKIMNYLSCLGLDSEVKSEVESSNSKAKSGKITVKVEQSTNVMLAYSIIVSRLDDALVIQLSLIERGNVRALLEALHNRFCSENFFSKLQARRDFNRIKLKQNESISSYGARVKYLAKELELMDNTTKVSEMELISRLVDGLPEDYDSLILGLVRGIETITFEEFVAILESKVSLSKVKGNKNSSNNDTSSIDAIVNTTVGGRYKFNGVCYKCNVHGHRAIHCPTAPGGATMSGSEENGLITL